MSRSGPLAWALVALFCFLHACAPAPEDLPAPEGLAGCPELPSSAAPTALPALDMVAEGVSRANLEAWIRWIAAPEHQGRRAGSPGARRVAGALAAYYQQLELSPAFADSFCQPYPFMGERDVNVAAHLSPPRGESLKTILIGAHYDSLGMHPRGAPFAGADDNASGVAALLEIARLARARVERWELELVVAAFGAEEVGMGGSRAYVAKPSRPLTDLALMINLDMVGRLREGEAPGLGFAALGQRANENQSRLRQAAERSGVTLAFDPRLIDDGYPRSDSSIFAPHVPTLFLSTGPHEDQHQLTDTVERLDLAQAEQSVTLLLALLEELATES